MVMAVVAFKSMYTKYFIILIYVINQSIFPAFLMKREYHPLQGVSLISWDGFRQPDLYEQILPLFLNSTSIEPSNLENQITRRQQYNEKNEIKDQNQEKQRFDCPELNFAKGFRVQIFKPTQQSQEQSQQIMRVERLKQYMIKNFADKYAGSKHYARSRLHILTNYWKRQDLRECFQLSQNYCGLLNYALETEFRLSQGDEEQYHRRELIKEYIEKIEEELRRSNQYLRQAECFIYMDKRKEKLGQVKFLQCLEFSRRRSAKPNKKPVEPKKEESSSQYKY